ncbi:MAG: ABC transporter ATP-binding protein [Hyphomicrobiaceae bacterium]
MIDPSFISIQSVSKSFGSVRAVDSVTLDIARGEFYGLLGPSGCGKTTLLRMLGGFETATSGEIYIDGQAMSRVPPHRRPVNMVFQNYAIFPHLNVFQNIAFGLRKERLDKPELTRRVDEALAMIRLGGYGQRAAHELSGGQRQRVALARALVRRPKVLLLDEPLGALDKKLREHMQIELRDLQRSLGITFILVTHDQEEALTMSDRIAVMADGRVIEEGPPVELYARPRTRFVADFIGLMNFFEGRIETQTGDRIIVDASPLGRVEVEARGRRFEAGQKVALALRPECVHLQPLGSPAGARAIVGTIDKLAYLGDRTLVHIVTKEGGRPVVATMARQDNASAATTFPERSDVRVSWQDSNLNLLDA